MKKSRFTDSQIMVVLKQAKACTPVLGLCRGQAISTATFFTWRAKFGGMDVSLMAKMKGLEDENRHLTKRYVGVHIRALIGEEVLAKNSSPISATGDGQVTTGQTQSVHQSSVGSRRPYECESYESTLHPFSALDPVRLSKTSRDATSQRCECCRYW